MLLRLIEVILVIACIFVIVMLVMKTPVFKGGSYNYDKFSNSTTETKDIFGNDVVMELDNFFSNILIHFNVIKTINGKTPTELYKENYDKIKFKEIYDKINKAKRIKSSPENKPIIENDVVSYDYSSIIISYDDYNLKISGKNEIFIDELPKLIHEYYLTKNMPTENKDFNGSLDYIFSFKDELDYPYLYIEDNHKYKRDRELSKNIQNEVNILMDNNKEFIYYYILNCVSNRIENINDFKQIVRICYEIVDGYYEESISDIVEIILDNQSLTTIDKYGLKIEPKNKNITIKQKYKNSKQKYENEYKIITNFNEFSKESKFYALTQLFVGNKVSEVVYKFYNINNNNLEKLDFAYIPQIITRTIIKMLFYYVVILYIDIISKSYGFEHVKYLEESYHKRLRDVPDFNRTFFTDYLFCPIQYFTKSLNIKSYLLHRISTDIRYHHKYINEDLMLLSNYVKNITFTDSDYDEILDHQNIDKFLKSDDLVKYCYNNANLTLASFIYITIMNKFIILLLKAPEFSIDTENNFLNLFSNDTFETSKKELAFYIVLFIALQKKLNHDIINHIRIILGINLRSICSNRPMQANLLKTNIESLFVTYEECVMIYGSNMHEDNKDNHSVIEYILFVYYGQKSFVVTERINYKYLSKLVIEEIYNSVYKLSKTSLTSEKVKNSSIRNIIDINEHNQLIIKCPELYKKIQIQLQIIIMDVISVYKMFSYPLLENNKNRIDLNYKNPFNVLYVFYGGNHHAFDYANVLKKIYE